MYLELYQKETEKLAERNGKLLKELHNKLMQTADLSLIEEQAMLHALQIIIENAIGKARHLLKAKNEKVPISAYDLFEQLKSLDVIDDAALQEWKKIIGLRNTIVHEYMKIDIPLVKIIVTNVSKFILTQEYPWKA
ncbi:MAG TPA: DUF86 domain-containing protein [Gammaproteobacteria bacterium]|nr:DUF86 domain-containing protein [Gammaproteobacteria bacterium]